MKMQRVCSSEKCIGIVPRGTFGFSSFLFANLEGDQPLCLEQIRASSNTQSTQIAPCLLAHLQRCDQNYCGPEALCHKLCAVRWRVIWGRRLGEERRFSSPVCACRRR